MIKNLAELRMNYKMHAFDVNDAQADPFLQFADWFHEAVKAELIEPNAFTLATCGNDRRPAARTLLLKGVEEGGFVFYTNYQSRKGQELLENPMACMQFLWLGLERQVRVEGKVAKLSEEASTAYFQSRPKESQIGAWASPQSSRIENRDILEVEMQKIGQEYAEAPFLPKPPHWGGYLLIPDYFEFWQGRPSRLHDRVEYVLNGNNWTKSRLAP